MNKVTQPTIKHSPPKGVTGPITEIFSMPSRFLVLKRYKDPEKRNIPIVNMIYETLMDWLFALENVDRNKSAKV